MIQNYTFTCILALIIILIKKIFKLKPQNVLESSNNKLIKIHVLIANDNQLVIEVNAWLGDQIEKCKYTRTWQNTLDT